MKIDEFDFEQTARAVFVMNDSVSEAYDSWEEFREFMISMAYRYASETTSFSTSGFQLTFYKGHDSEINCRASVSAYVANLYIKKVQKSLSNV